MANPLNCKEELWKRQLESDKLKALLIRLCRDEVTTFHRIKSTIRVRNEKGWGNK